MQRKTKGILLIALPIPTLFVVMSGYAILSFVIANLTEATGGGGSILVIGSIVNLILGLVAIIAVVGILVGIPVGIYLLATEDKTSTPAVKK